MLETSQIIPLKDLCDNYKKDIVDSPFGANLKREHYISEGVSILKIQNVKPFQIILKKMDYISNDKAAELQRHAYKKGDIIITKLGMPLGASAIVGEEMDDGVIVADLVRVRASSIDTRYLCYHLNSPNTCDYLNAQSSGATRPRVKISAVRELPIYTPPLPEQKRIVAILDKAFAGISLAVASAEKNLANARELFESYLNDVFTQKADGWVEKPLGEVCVLQRGFDLPKRVRIKGDFPLVSSSGAIDTHIESKVKAPGVATGRSGSIGNVFFITEDYWPLNTVLYVKEFFGNEPYFVFYLLKQFGLEKYAGGAGVPTLNRNNVHSVSVAIPKNIEEQKQITKKLDLLQEQVRLLETIYQQKLTALNELKQSLLQKAFTGGLTQRQENV